MPGSTTQLGVSRRPWLRYSRRLALPNPPAGPGGPFLAAGCSRKRGPAAVGPCHLDDVLLLKDLDGRFHGHHTRH